MPDHLPDGEYTADDVDEQPPAGFSLAAEQRDDGEQGGAHFRPDDFEDGQLDLDDADEQDGVADDGDDDAIEDDHREPVGEDI